MQPGKVKIYRNVKEGEPNQLLPFYLPNQNRNSFEIVSKILGAGSSYPVVSFRNSMFMGLMARSMTFKKPIKFHFLKDKWGVLMSSIPQEIEQHSRQLRRAKGKVLVGGLGLGLAVALLEENPKVERITLVEIQEDVLRMILPYMPQRKTEIIHGDLKQILALAKEKGQKWDFGYFDIWRGTGEYDHAMEVWPLRRLSLNVIPQGQLELWNEAEMIGQIAVGLHSMIMMRNNPQGKELFDSLDEGYRAANKSRWPFVNYLLKEQPSDKEAMKQLGSFIRDLRNPVLHEARWGKYDKHED